MTMVSLSDFSSCSRSHVPQQQHAAYNQALNKLVQRSNQPAYTNARIRYEHTKVVDSFYPQPGGGGRVRVTTDEKTGEVKECVQKTRIADLNVYSPKRKMDWRVSVSTEVPGPSSCFFLDSIVEERC